MKKLTVHMLALGMTAAPLLAFAQNPDLSAPMTIITGSLGILSTVVTILFVLAIAVFAWGIVKMVMAAGDPEAVKEARGIIIWGVIAIAVLASLFGLVAYLKTVFGVMTGTLELGIPNVKPGMFGMPAVK